MTANAPPAQDNPPLIVKHSACPEWGLGYLVEERDDKRIYDFEDGRNHSIAKAYWSKLEPVELGSAEARALEKKVRGLRDQRPSPGKAKPRAVAPVFPSFDAQVKRFEEIFPGGFAGERFMQEERGEEPGGAAATGKKAKGFKTAAIETTRRLLSREEMDKQIAAGAFGDAVANVKAVHKAAGNLLHPLGDLIPFGKMPTENQRAFVEAAREMLHGSGPAEERFDKLVAALAQSNLATWPLATVLGALYAPEEHVFVKPSFYEKQAALLSFDLRYERVPSSAAYARMQALSREVEKRLVSRGHAPRDQMDVYAFIWRTLSPQKKP
ncbi:hypothetical protein [Polyangium aurulentum]|uniref:hypothetical protein n=1 Tax=Polyangium aurulentum TaxID=2567896 RepID=UPI0010AE4834|nr:hypothetical protein [Polyangium aurulentum]UQA62106.1 hypothetical protein E8A73_017170 [Polyangium aurulentum]